MPSYTYSSTSPDCWWDASYEIYKDAGSTVAVPGTDTVQQWNDARGSGSGYTLSQATSGNRPIATANVKNSLPGLKCTSASDQRMTCSYAGEPGTIIAVIKVDGFGFFDGIAGADTSDAVAAPAWLWIINPDQKLQFARITSAESNPLGGSFDLKAGDLLVASGTTYLMTNRLNTGASPKTIENWKQSHGDRGSDSSSSSLRPITGGTVIGSFYYSSAIDNSANITICEMLIWSSALSDDEMTQVQKALFLKYAFGAGTSTPDYLQANFITSDENLYISESTDGLTWYNRPCSYSPGGGENTVRDPSIYQPDLNNNDNYFGAHTINQDYGGTASTSFQVMKSVDGGFVWSVVGTVDCSAVVSTSGARVWAPEIFRDATASQGARVFFVGTSAYPNNFAIYETHPTNAGWTTWSTPVAVTGSALPSSCIDPYMVEYAGAWYLWVKKEGGTSYIEVYKSTTSAVAGFDTALRTGDAFGWGGNTYEGESIILLGSGSWRAWIDNPSSGQGVKYSTQTAGDWMSGGSTTWGAPAAITYDLDVFAADLRHGTVIYGPAVVATKAPPPFLQRIWRRWPRR